jgi:serine kinase of HPr protein (carbohydrate metabolism regulator)
MYDSELTCRALPKSGIKTVTLDKNAEQITNVSCVAISGRAIVIQGKPGSGKSSLALGLIDRGGVLVGDDGISIAKRGKRLWASPAPNIAGKLEVRGVGIFDMPTTHAPIALILRLCAMAERMPEVQTAAISGISIPQIDFQAAGAFQAIRAELALSRFGLT